jgi:hypothetical protein
VLRLARLEETRALQALALSQRRADELRAELSGVEGARAVAVEESRPAPSRTQPAFHLQAALQRVRALENQALDLGPRVGVAEVDLEEKREGVARSQLRTRGLERAIERRESILRMEERRRETRRIDDTVRATRQTAERESA